VTGAGKRQEAHDWPRDRVVVITGGASGIGAATAHAFGKAGARIALLDRDAAEAEKQRDRLLQEGIAAISFPCDIADESQCRTAMEAAGSHFGRIDILFNNAGITQRGPFREATTAAIRRVMETNFFGALYCTKAALESLIACRGMIIVTSSIAGLAPVLGRTAYCASKHALHGLFGTLRSELKDLGVHVMIVCPGFTRTNLQVRALDPRGEVNVHERTKVGRVASPEEVAAAIVRGAARRKDLLVLSATGRLSHALFRLSPPLYAWLMSRSLRDEIQR
jgi:NAD(P)-dependent dehydrogenase (short-subunit alcohol dehydrogenase family)